MPQIVLEYVATAIQGKAEIYGQLRFVQVDATGEAPPLSGTWSLLMDTGGLIAEVVDDRFTINPIYGSQGQVESDGGSLYEFAADWDGPDTCGGPQAQVVLALLPDNSIVDYPDGHPATWFDCYLTATDRLCTEYRLDVTGGSYTPDGGYSGGAEPPPSVADVTLDPN